MSRSSVDVDDDLLQQATQRTGASPADAVEAALRASLARVPGNPAAQRELSEDEVLELAYRELHASRR